MDQETILSRNFYERPTVEVAQALLGKQLVRTMLSGQQLSGMIVETEAYLGFRDPACHTYEGKKSKKNASMYLNGGYAYVYLIYGMYHCFNVVTLSEGEPEAVLIRALEPVDGIPQMRKYRQKVKKEKDLANGPCVTQLQKTPIFPKNPLIDFSISKDNSLFVII